MRNTTTTTKTTDDSSAVLRRAARKIYRASRRGQLDTLLDERRHWRRRATIARNKLDEVERKMDNMLHGWAESEFGGAQ